MLDNQWLLLLLRETRKKSGKIACSPPYTRKALFFAFLPRKIVRFIFLGVRNDEVRWADRCSFNSCRPQSYGNFTSLASFCFLTRMKPLIFNFSPLPTLCFLQVFLSELLGSSHEKGMEGLRDGLGMPSGWTLNFVHPEGVFCRASLACTCRTYFRTIIFTVRPSARRTMLMPLVGDCSCRPSGV